MRVLKTYAQVHVRVLAHTCAWINQLNQLARLQSNGSEACGLCLLGRALNIQLTLVLITSIDTNCNRIAF